MGGVPGEVARWILAVVLVAMAVGQLSDVGGFVDVVATYRVGGSALAGVVGAVLIGGEAVAGVGLLSSETARRRRAAIVAMVVAGLWSLLAVQAFARGMALDNCGCFGVHLAQPLRWWVLVEDAELVALTLWVRRQLPMPAPVDPTALAQDVNSS